MIKPRLRTTRQVCKILCKQYLLNFLSDLKVLAFVYILHFTASPKEFVPPFAKVALPSEHLLPKQHSQDEVKSLFPMQLQFGGYCPVEYVEKKFR